MLSAEPRVNYPYLTTAKQVPGDIETYFESGAEKTANYVTHFAEGIISGDATTHSYTRDASGSEDSFDYVTLTSEGKGEERASARNGRVKKTGNSSKGSYNNGKHAAFRMVFNSKTNKGQNSRKDRDRSATSSPRVYPKPTSSQSLDMAEDEHAGGSEPGPRCGAAGGGGGGPGDNAHVSFHPSGHQYFSAPQVPVHVYGDHNHQGHLAHHQVAFPSQPPPMNYAGGVHHGHQPESEIPRPPQVFTAFSGPPPPHLQGTQPLHVQAPVLPPHPHHYHFIPMSSSQTYGYQAPPPQPTFPPPPQPPPPPPSQLGPHQSAERQPSVFQLAVPGAPTDASVQHRVPAFSQELHQVQGPVTRVLPPAPEGNGHQSSGQEQQAHHAAPQQCNGVMVHGPHHQQHHQGNPPQHVIQQGHHAHHAGLPGQHLGNPVAPGTVHLQEGHPWNGIGPGGGWAAGVPLHSGHPGDTQHQHQHHQSHQLHSVHGAHVFQHQPPAGSFPAAQGHPAPHPFPPSQGAAGGGFYTVGHAVPVPGCQGVSQGVHVHHQQHQQQHHHQHQQQQLQHQHTVRHAESQGLVGGHQQMIQPSGQHPPTSCIVLHPKQSVQNATPVAYNPQGLPQHIPGSVQHVPPQGPLLHAPVALVRPGSHPSANLPPHHQQGYPLVAVGPGHPIGMQCPPREAFQIVAYPHPRSMSRSPAQSPAPLPPTSGQRGYYPLDLAGRKGGKTKRKKKKKSPLGSMAAMSMGDGAMRKAISELSLASECETVGSSYSPLREGSRRGTPDRLMSPLVRNADMDDGGEGAYPPDQDQANEHYDTAAQTPNGVDGDADEISVMEGTSAVTELRQGMDQNNAGHSAETLNGLEANEGEEYPDQELEVHDTAGRDKSFLPSSGRHSQADRSSLSRSTPSSQSTQGVDAIIAVTTTTTTQPSYPTSTAQQQPGHYAPLLGDQARRAVAKERRQSWTGQEGSSAPKYRRRSSGSTSSFRPDSPWDGGPFPPNPPRRPPGGWMKPMPRFEANHNTGYWGRGGEYHPGPFRGYAVPPPQPFWGGEPPFRPPFCEGPPQGHMTEWAPPPPHWNQKSRGGGGSGYRRYSYGNEDRNRKGNQNQMFINTKAKEEKEIPAGSVAVSSSSVAAEIKEPSADAGNKLNVEVLGDDKSENVNTALDKQTSKGVNVDEEMNDLEKSLTDSSKTENEMSTVTSQMKALRVNDVCNTVQNAQGNSRLNINVNSVSVSGTAEKFAEIDINQNIVEVKHLDIATSSHSALADSKNASEATDTRQSPTKSVNKTPDNSENILSVKPSASKSENTNFSHCPVAPDQPIEMIDMSPRSSEVADSDSKILNSNGVKTLKRASMDPINAVPSKKSRDADKSATCASGEEDDEDSVKCVKTMVFTPTINSIKAEVTPKEQHSKLKLSDDRTPGNVPSPLPTDLEMQKTETKDATDPNKERAAAEVPKQATKRAAEDKKAGEEVVSPKLMKPDDPSSEAMNTSAKSVSITETVSLDSSVGGGSETSWAAIVEQTEAQGNGLSDVETKAVFVCTDTPAQNTSPVNAAAGSASSSQRTVTEKRSKPLLESPGVKDFSKVQEATSRTRSYTPQSTEQRLDLHVEHQQGHREAMGQGDQSWGEQSSYSGSAMVKLQANPQPSTFHPPHPSPGVPPGPHSIPVNVPQGFHGSPSAPFALPQHLLSVFFPFGFDPRVPPPSWQNQGHPPPSREESPRRKGPTPRRGRGSTPDGRGRSQDARQTVQSVDPEAFIGNFMYRGTETPDSSSKNRWCPLAQCYPHLNDRCPMVPPMIIRVTYNSASSDEGEDVAEDRIETKGALVQRKGVDAVARRRLSSEKVIDIIIDPYELEDDVIVSSVPIRCQDVPEKSMGRTRGYVSVQRCETFEDDATKTTDSPDASAKITEVPEDICWTEEMNVVDDLDLNLEKTPPSDKEVKGKVASPRDGVKDRKDKAEEKTKISPKTPKRNRGNKKGEKTAPEHPKERVSPQAAAPQAQAKTQQSTEVKRSRRNRNHRKGAHSKRDKDVKSDVSTSSDGSMDGAGTTSKTVDVLVSREVKVGFNGAKNASKSFTADQEKTKKSRKPQKSTAGGDEKRTGPQSSSALSSKPPSSSSSKYKNRTADKTKADSTSRHSAVQPGKGNQGQGEVKVKGSPDMTSSVSRGKGASTPSHSPKSNSAASTPPKKPVESGKTTGNAAKAGSKGNLTLEGVMGMERRRDTGHTPGNKKQQRKDSGLLSPSSRSD